MNLIYAKDVLKRAKDSLETSKNPTYVELLTPKVNRVEEAIRLEENTQKSSNKKDMGSPQLSEILISLVVDLERSI